MKTKMILSMVLLCSGCAVFQSDPAAELNAAQIMFERTVRALTIVRRDGGFTESEGEHISGLIYSTEALLIQWEEIVFTEDRRPEYGEVRGYFDAMIKEMRSYLKEQ